MLDAFIIEELKRRQEERRRQDRRPVLEVPEPTDEPGDEEDSEEEQDGDRGVVIIDYGN